MTKTNAMRLLDQAGIEYIAREYEVDENDVSGVHVAATAGLEVERVFKTLVARTEPGGIHVFCIPSAEELDLKKAASKTQNKRVEMIHVKELLGLTGYIRGGCSPVGMKKKYPTFIDETAVLFDTIYVSGGQRGLQIEINPEVLADFVNGEFLDLTK